MPKQRYTDAEMIAEMQRLAVRGELSRPKYARANPRISAPAIEARFGGWLRAIALAGLKSPYAYGGRWLPCPVCGTPFRSLGGRKAAITCGKRACSAESRRRNNPNYKGPLASRSAARGRSLYVKPDGPCERCGHTGERYRVERHHKNRDVYDNRTENIELLCQSCHAKEHISDGDQPYLDGDALMRGLGFAVLKLWPMGGLPVRRYYRPLRTYEVRSPLVVWWEAKRTGGKQSPHQKAFQAMAESCCEEYVCGDLAALLAWCRSKNLVTGRTEVTG